MAEDPTKASVSETDQQQTSDALSDGAIESMLAGVPGLEKYFGEVEQSGDQQPVASGEEPAVETAEPPLEETPAAQEEEKKEAFPESVQRRIDQLVAQKYEAVEKAEALASRIKELEARVENLAPLAPTADSPLADVETAEDLGKRLSDARRVKTWALEHLEGGEVEDGKGGTKFLEGQQVRRLLATAEALISEHIPQRDQYLRARAGFDAEARRYYPELYKQGTEMNQVYNTWVRIFPQVRNFPDFQLIIADALIGQKIRFAKSKAATNGKAAPSRTSTLAAPSPSSGTKISQKSVLSKELLNRIATDRSALDVFSESLIGRGSTRER